MNANPTGIASLMKAAAPYMGAAVAAGVEALRRKQTTSSSSRRRRRRRKTRDREFQAPVARGRIVRNAPAPTVRVRHREFLQDISVTASTDARWQIAINPGLSFPWLSGIARNFEKYRFHRLSFEYVTATATATTGAIALAPEYDPDDVDYGLSKRQLYMFDGVVRGPLWNSLKLDFRCPRREFFMREHTLEDASLKWHDPGQLIVDVSDPSVSGVVGELWVEYDVTLRIPEYEDNTTTSAHYDSTVAWNEVVAGTQFSWPLDENDLDGIDEPKLIPVPYHDYLYRNWLSSVTPGVYSVVLQVSGATAITSIDAPVVYAGSGSFYGDDDAVIKLTETINAAATEMTATYSVVVGEEYNKGTSSYTRNYKTPVIFNLGTLRCTASPTSVTLWITKAD